MRSAGLNPKLAASLRMSSAARVRMPTAGCGMMVPFPASVTRPSRLISSVAHTNSDQASQ